MSYVSFGCNLSETCRGRAQCGRERNHDTDQSDFACDVHKFCMESEVAQLIDVDIILVMSVVLF